MEDAPNFENSKIRMSRYSDTSHEHKLPKSWSSMEEPIVRLERNLYGHFLAGLVVGEAIRESSIGTRLGTSSKLGMFFVNREKGLFLSVYVDDIKLAGKKQNIEPTWTMFMKDVDLGEPTSFLDHVHLGCTQRECQISKNIVQEKYRLKPQGNVMQKQYLLAPMTWKVMQRNAWKDSASRRIKQLNNFVRSRHHAWMTIN